MYDLCHVWTDTGKSQDSGSPLTLLVLGVASLNTRAPELSVNDFSPQILLNQIENVMLSAVRFQKLTMKPPHG